MRNNSLEDGSITRSPQGTIVEVLDEPYSLDYGATCSNPEEPDTSKRVYQKTFVRKPIYAFDEYEAAIARHIGGKEVFVLSMNGYSSLKPKHLKMYGVAAGAYEEACAAILTKTIEHLRGKFVKVQLKLIYGASDMGVDKAIQQVAETLNDVPLLGFSCPRYLLYCKDDEVPVWGGRNREEYADMYVKSLDMLITTGGREQALTHDIKCACKYQKRIHFVDVMSFLSETGSVPATIIDDDGEPQIENAAAAFGRFISFTNRDTSAPLKPADGDEWDALFLEVSGVATDVCRRKLSPTAKFDTRR